MNTPTHLIAASAVLSRPHRRLRNRAVLAGALIPDLFIYILSGWALLTGRMNEDLWQITYWQEPWQSLGAISNSVPLALAILGIGIWRKWAWLSLMAAAMLIHAALDFPLHADDAHRHFWPISDWRFHSPVSYWNPDHHGLWGGILDCAVLFAGLAILWLRFTAKWTRFLFAILAALGIVYLSLIIGIASPGP